jgi:AraC-like DNA-binding protein
MYIHFSTEEGDTYGAAETKKDCVLLPSFLSCRGNEKIKLRMQELISVFFRAGSFDHKLHLLLDLLLSDLAEQAAPASHAKDELIEKLILHMQSVPHKFFTAKEFGELFNIGERTLWNRFKNACHQTIYQYQMDLKLKMIHSYICENVEATAFEIAQNYGFYDEFHLSKHFKKHFGYTVSHLRARIGHK